MTLHRAHSAPHIARALRLSLLVACASAAVVITLGRPTAEKFYPTLSIRAGESVQLTVLQDGLASQAECTKRVHAVAQAVTADCADCKVTSERCSTNLSPTQQRLLKGHATDVAVARFASGVIAYTASSPELALQTCLEVERVYAGSGALGVDCVPGSSRNLSGEHNQLVPPRSTILPPADTLAGLTLLAAAIAFLACYLMVTFQRVLALIGLDQPGSGPQKFHTKPTPRIGGVALALALVACVIGLRYQESLALATANGIAMLALSAIPAFFGGLGEDLTKRVGVLARLLLTTSAGVVAALAVGATLDRLDVPGLDSLLLMPVVPIVFTAFAVGGVANAINIIDGYNGLVAGYSIIVLTAMAALAAVLGDGVVLVASLIMAGALLGFVTWNWPLGRIFLGDGGAYLLGFWLAELSVLLVVRNPSVSPWFPFALLVYPIFETLFSIYRRSLVRGQPAGSPDGFHFHTLIFKRLVRINVGRKDHAAKLARNNRVAPYIWLMTAAVCIGALLLWQNTIALITLALVFCAAYVWLYNRLLHWRAPKWLVVPHKLRGSTRVRAQSEQPTDYRPV